MADIRSVNIKDGVISAVETGTDCAICGEFIPCEPYMKVFPVCRECRKRLNELLYQKNGNWETEICDDGYGAYNLYKCSVCGSESAQKFNFCRDCGAKMEKGDTN